MAWVRDLGLRPVLLTGDNSRAAQAVAGQLGIPAAEVFAGVRPEGKVEAIRRLQSAGVTVGFVGDGVNDAAALAQADLGMAIGAGTDAAIGAADLTLVSSDPLSIVSAIKLARATMAVIRANLAWASGYNLIAIPLAALGYLNPLFAGIAMSASSLIVVANSLRLRHFHARRGPRPDPRAGTGEQSSIRPGSGGGRPVTATAAPSAAPARDEPGRNVLRDLARAAIGPVICAVVLTGLLSAWVATGGAGTLSRVKLQVSLAAVPMRAFTPRAAASAGPATTFLTIRNLSGTPDKLVAARSPIARHVVLTVRNGLAGPRVVVSDLAIPAHGTLTLSPFGDDVVLQEPAPFETRQSVPLILTFRHAGTVTIEATVTAPGTP